MKLKLKLPFNYSIVGLVQKGDVLYVAVEDNDNPGKFVTYEVDLQGNCYLGNYYDNRIEALENMLARSKSQATVTVIWMDEEGKFFFTPINVPQHWKDNPPYIRIFLHLAYVEHLRRTSQDRLHIEEAKKNGAPCMAEVVAVLDGMPKIILRTS